MQTSVFFNILITHLSENCAAIVVTRFILHYDLSDIPTIYNSFLMLDRRSDLIPIIHT